MTIASLVVTLQGQTSDFHDKMETAARHMEMVGRRIARAGHEITLAVAPFAAPTCWKMLGATSVARIAITTITTRISIRVNPEGERRP